MRRNNKILSFPRKREPSAWVVTHFEISPPLTGWPQGADIRPMPKRSSKPKRPRDANQLGKLIVDLSVGEAEEPAAPLPDDSGKDPAAVSLGRRGGLKGGEARAKALSAKRRKEIAKKAAKARWK